MREREGYHSTNTHITKTAWERLCAAADERGRSITRVLNELLHQHFAIPLSEIPPLRRTGRKPKRLSAVDNAEEVKNEL
jgi:hypothetical protein